MTVTYLAGSSGIEAKLTLESARVPDTYRFALDMSRGLRLKSGDDGIVVVDSSGQVRFSFPIPAAVDSSGETSQGDLRFEHRGSGYLVSLHVDRGWLRADERVYPVEIDQTISNLADSDSATIDCLIQSKPPKNKSFCTSPVLAVGSRGKDLARTLLRFDVNGSLPQGVDVASARIGLYKWWQAGRNAAQIDVHALTKPFTETATWRRYDADYSWAALGGDYVESALATASSNERMNFEWWNLSDFETLQQIADGSVANNGFLLKQQDEKVNGFQAFFSSEFRRPSLQPRLEITYKPADEAIPSAPTLNETTITPFVDQTSFLYTGDDPVQTGVAEETIERTRAAVIRGKVTTREGDPLPGVTVTVLDHPEFGQTESRIDGSIYMAVNGGGPLTVVLQKDGYLESQRQVDVPWQDYAWIDDVALVPLDSQVSTVNLADGTLQVARGSQVTDSAGTRQATLIFPAGTTAAMNMPDGSSQPLENLNVRMTEYTVGASGPQSMPAELPASTAYTYAVEYSVDEAMAIGASAVEFSQPVVSYTENFIGFKV